MDDCPSVTKLLYPYLDRELATHEGDRIERHLATCSACGERFDREREFLSFLRTNVVSPPPTASKAGRFLEGVQLPLLFPDSGSPGEDSPRHPP
jgi:predicted anti-sigma-YlaC factor YlaD